MIGELGFAGAVAAATAGLYARAKRKTFVLYHDSCADGFGAAFAAWCSLGDSAEYIPVQYGEPWPSLPDGARVFIVDFSYPVNSRAREELCALSERCELTVIDHHKTAREALEGLPFAIFDMEKSGAVLAWEYFQTQTPADGAYGVLGPAPELLLYIQDRDLWRWELPHSREYSAGLALVPREFDRWLAIIVPENGRRKELIAQGTIALKRDEIHVNALAKKAHFRHLKRSDLTRTQALVINSPILNSEICHEILATRPDTDVAACYFDKDEVTRVWSLRSRKGGVDVSEIAKANGGGGHPNAAGFTELL